MSAPCIPESFVFRTPDRYKTKNIDSGIRYICTLEGTVRVIVP